MIPPLDFRNLANSFVREIMPYQPGKPIEELERELGIKSAIKLASNENPLGPSPLALRAVIENLQRAHIYPDGGCFELKQALAQFYAVSPSQITVGNGSDNILELIVKSYLNTDTNAVVSQYAFITIPLLLQSYGISAHVIAANNWHHDIDKMIAAVNKNTRVLFLVNPNNPTGTYIPAPLFHSLMESVPPCVLVVVDEAYFEYMKKPDYPNTLACLGKYPNLVITRTFSKVYGLAALRLGYAISSPDIADILNRVRLPFNVNTLAAKAACAALTDTHHVAKSVQLIFEGMAQMEKALTQLHIEYIPSVGNFLTINVGDAINVFQKLCHQGVIVRPLKPYGMPKHIRVTIGTHEQNERFLAALQKVMS